MPLWCGLFALALVGCGVETLTATAVQSELQAQQAKAVTRQAEAMAGQTAKVNIRRAIDTYYAEKGAYPPSLQALVPGYLPALPKRPDGAPYGYDPNAGKLLDVPGPTLEDYGTMGRIQEAINEYAADTGYYPPSLEALATDYLPAVPRTATGEPFLYYPNSGYVAHPGQVASGTTASPAHRGGNVGAATGMQMRNELGNTNNAARHRTRRRSRDGVQQFETQRNDKINQVMDGLDL